MSLPASNASAQNKANTTIADLTNMLGLLNVSSLNNQSRVSAPGEGTSKSAQRRHNKALKQGSQSNNQSAQQRINRSNTNNNGNGNNRQQQSRGNTGLSQSDIDRISNSIARKMDKQQQPNLDLSNILSSLDSSMFTDGSTNSKYDNGNQQPYIPDANFDQYVAAPSERYPIHQLDHYGLVSKNMSMDANYAKSAVAKHDLYKSLVFPEMGQPGQLPGMDLSCTGTHWKSFNFTPGAGGYAYLLLNPRNLVGSSTINAANLNGTFFCYSTADGSGGITIANQNTVEFPQYTDLTNIESFRVTGACMVIRCINPGAQAASGTIAVSHQSRPFFSVPNNQYLSTTSQHDVELSVSRFNGQIAGLNEVAKAVWLPRDTNEMSYRGPLDNLENTSFIGACISGSNNSTNFRADIYVNYEYQPGVNLENVVTPTGPGLTDPGDLAEVMVHATPMIAKDMKDQDSTWNPFKSAVNYITGDSQSAKAVRQIGANILGAGLSAGAGTAGLAGKIIRAALGYQYAK